MRKDSGHYVITNWEWNLSWYSSFLHNTDAQMCLPGRELNVRMDTWKIFEFCWVGCLKVGSVGWPKIFIHAFFHTPPLHPNWIYLLSSLIPLIEFIAAPPPINFTLKSSHDQINHEHPLPQSNFVWPTLHAPAPLPQLIFFFACLSYIIFNGKALRKVYHHSALLLLEKV